jgi:hypothetical protein
MIRYRKDFNKLAKKLNKIAQKGENAKFEFYEFIDEIITLNQYSIFEDIMITKYGIDIKKYKTVEDVKNETFEDIRRVTNFSTQIFFKDLIDENNVYNLGFHYYDKTTNQYIGDIIEYEQTTNFSEKKLIEVFLNLDSIVGLSSSIYSAIPTFVNNPSEVIKFEVSSQVLYQGNIYHCTQSYTYSATAKYTPTFSNYWVQVLSPTYSLTSFTNSSITLLEKYKLAINTLKSYNYTIV